MPLFYDKLREGVVYDISDFTIAVTSGSFLPIHKVINIQFHALTAFTEVENQAEHIPMHKFSFVDHPTMIKRTDTTKFLTDVIDVLHRVGEVVSQSTKNGSVMSK